MSIFTPEIGTTYGSLDSTAFVDGGPYSAHMLRTMIRARNRLVAKGHEAFNLVWPTLEQAADESTNVYPFSTVAPPFWAPLCPPIVVEKKPGLTELNVIIKARLPGAEVFQVQVGTRAQPFRSNGPYTEFTADNDDDWDNYTCGNVPVSPDGHEEIQLWFRGIPDGTLVTTGTVGTPNTSTSSSMVITQEMVVLSTASWNALASGTNNLAENGTAVVFNGSIGPITYPRLVVDVISDRFNFAPLLTLNELADARLGQDFDLVELPTIAVANIMGYYDDRSL